MSWGVRKLRGVLTDEDLVGRNMYRDSKVTWKVVKIILYMMF